MRAYGHSGIRSPEFQSVRLVALASPKGDNDLNSFAATSPARERANEDVPRYTARKVVLRLKLSKRNSAPILLMTPLHFLRAPSRWVRAQWHLIRFDGVWTPNANLRPHASLSSNNCRSYRSLN